MKRLFAAMLLVALAPAACAALPDCLAVRAADPVAGRRCLQGEA
jgi:hypothetical protein